jgi:hypothetical protein
MGIHGHVANDDEIFNAIDDFLADRLHRGLGEELFTGGNVEETDIVEGGMAFALHDN